MKPATTCRVDLSCRDLVGLAVANVAAGLSGTFVVNGSPTKTEMVYHTVEGGIGVTYAKEGPCNLVTTMTLPLLEGQLETRCVSVTVDESAAQTRAILQRKAERAQSEGQEHAVPEQVLAVQHWLQHCDVHDAVVPFAGLLAAAMSERQVRVLRLRRDFTTILALIKTSALLHQEQRKKTPGGLPTASTLDYRVVYEALGAPFQTAMTGFTTDQRAALVLGRYSSRLPLAGPCWPAPSSAWRGTWQPRCPTWPVMTSRRL